MPPYQNQGSLSPQALFMQRAGIPTGGNAFQRNWREANLVNAMGAAPPTGLGALAVSSDAVPLGLLPPPLARAAYYAAMRDVHGSTPPYLRAGQGSTSYSLPTSQRPATPKPDPVATGVAAAKEATGLGGFSGNMVPTSAYGGDDTPVYGEASEGDPIQKIIADLMNSNVSDTDKWLALARGGFGMAASQKPFFGALAEGAGIGLSAYQAAQQQAAQDRLKGLGLKLDVDQLAEARAQAKDEAAFNREKFGFEKYSKEQELAMDRAYKEAMAKAALTNAAAGGAGGVGSTKDERLIQMYMQRGLTFEQAIQKVGEYNAQMSKLDATFTSNLLRDKLKALAEIDADSMMTPEDKAAAIASVEKRYTEILGGGAASGAGEQTKYAPGTVVVIKGKRYRVGADGYSATPIE